MIHHTKLKFRECLKRRRETKYIVVHHTAVTDDEQPVTLVHQWHLERKTKDGKPWAGIGYHYYIRRSGEIYQGRPRNKKGSHVYVDDAHRFNSITIGVCFEGDFRTEVMSEKQLEASVMLLSVLSLGYGNIDICKHSYLDKRTTCPGKNFPFPELIKRVHDQKQRFIDLYGDPSEVNYRFLLKKLD
jgi:N-acetyl-anhydromuramyl-L-alanine amidase AmpD